MARACKTLRRYLLAVRAAVSVLLVLTCLWTVSCALSLNLHQCWLVSGVTIPFAVLGLYGLVRSRRTIFLGSGSFLIAVFGALVISGLMGTFEQILTGFSLLLTIIFVMELGGSSMSFNRIIHGMKEPMDEAIVTRTKKALTRYLVSLSGVMGATFLLSVSLFILGAASGFPVTPSFAVAIAVAVLLTGLVLLGTNRAVEQ